MIVRIFKRLQESKVEVSTASYSLIKMSIESDEMRNSYFEIDANELTPSEVGVDRYQRMLFCEDAPITNPRCFNEFKSVFEHRKSIAPDLLPLIEAGEISTSEASESLRRRLSARAFEEQLEIAIKDLNAIPVESFRGVDSELQLVEKLIKVSLKIGRLACSASVPKLLELQQFFSRK